MTSKLTRERIQQIFLGNGPEPSASEERELARMALAAIDSESGYLPLDYLQGHKDGLEWAAQLAEANHPETGDWLYDDPIELAKAIRKGPDMPPVQPVADSEPVAWEVKGILCHTLEEARKYVGVPEPLYSHSRVEQTSSEPVAWLLSGGGAKDAVCFDRVNAYADPLREVTPLYRHAQPAPVVPDDVLNALHKVARIRLDMDGFDGDRRGIADCLCDAEEALIEVVNRRAAMLQASPLESKK